MASLLWDHRGADNWYCDVAGLGRFLIQRERRGSRTFVLRHNGHRSSFSGTVDELKVVVARIVAAYELGLQEQQAGQVRDNFHVGE